MTQAQVLNSVCNSPALGLGVDEAPLMLVRHLVRSRARPSDAAIGSAQAQRGLGDKVVALR